jgi:SWI/SNF-related matrix-associated actin-dependent regulator 1 of chromatin subfamily A
MSEYALGVNHRIGTRRDKMKIELLGEKSFVARSTFEERAIPKQAGFRWNPAQKVWWTDDPDKVLKLTEYCTDEVKKKVNGILEARKEALEKSRATTADIEIPAPENLAYLPFQKAGISYALDKSTVLIGDEMGLGKTIQAIGIINAKPEIKTALVICPASLKLNWKRELEKWITRPMSVEIVNGSFPDADVVIVNYDILKKYRATLRKKIWDIVIVDECHYLKNPKAQRTGEVLGKWNKDPQKEIKPIPADRKVYLTGTPIVNRPIELYPILKSTGTPEWHNWKKYVERYCNGHQTRWGWDVTGATNLSELQEKLRTQLMVRRLKKDVLTELPAKRRQIIELPANGVVKVIDNETRAWMRQQEIIESLQEAVELSKASEDVEDYEKAVSELKEAMQVAFTEMSKLRHDTALAKVPYVAEHVIESMDQSGKVVLFAHHKDVIAEVKKCLDDAGISAVLLTGDMDMKTRQESVDRFQNDESVKVFIGTIGAAGVGITLTAASHVIFAELDWVPGNMSQAEDRCHRIGQTDSVLVQHLVLEGSLDSKIAETIVEKQNVIDTALDKDIQIDKSWGTMISVIDSATKNTRRDQIEKEAEEITGMEIEDIHAKLKYLASMCDGARELDGVGFSRIDANIGHSLAGAIELTPKQAVLGRRLVHKYRRQLEGV